MVEKLSLLSLFLLSMLSTNLIYDIFLVRTVRNSYIECRVNLGFAEKMALAGLEVDIVHIWSLPSLISRAILAPPSPAADQQMWIYIFLVLILTHSQYSTHWTIYFVTSLWTWEELDCIFSSSDIHWHHKLVIVSHCVLTARVPQAYMASPKVPCLN